MNKINNTQGIEKIVMKPTAFTKCELGGDYYKNDLEITFIPEKWYPDYTEIQNWAMENIDGKTLNIEDVVLLFYNFINDNYEPFELKVVNHVTDCRTHFDVIVEK